MLRKLALSLAVAGALSATQANALGLGEIRVNSALNEPLNAEIKLLQVRDLSPLQIQPRMADIDEFSLAGISKSRFLSDVSFDVRVMPDGSGIIRMKSTAPIKEPFLNFLVEVNWPAGRLVREYTLLLDPPVFDPTPVPGVTSVQQAESTAASMPRSTTAQPLTSKPARPENVSNIKTRMDPNSEVYVDVQTTLWELALKHRPSSQVTPEQMMLALVRKNPESFPTGNINVMKAGTVMRLPTLDEINTLTPAQARAEAARQTQAWRQGRSASQPAAETMKAKEASDTGKPSEPAKPEQQAASADAGASDDPASQLKVVAPEGGAIDASAQSATSDDMSANEQAGSEQSAGAQDEMASEQAQALIQRNEELENRLLVTQESISVIERENTELNDKVDAIASQLDKLQRLIELKDRELALMQQQLQQKEAAAASANSGSFVDKVMQSPTYLGAIGAGAVAILLGLLLALRKRKSREPESAEPFLQTEKSVKADADAIPQMAATAAAAGAVAAAASEPEEVEAEPSVEAAPLAVSEPDEIDDLDLDLDMDMELDLDESASAASQPVSGAIDDEEFDLGIEEIESAPQADESLDSALDDILAGSAEVQGDDDIDTGLDDLLSETAGADDFADDLPGPLDEPELEQSSSTEEVDEDDSIDGLDFSIDTPRQQAEEEELLDLPDDLEFDLAKALSDTDEGAEDVGQEAAVEEDELAGLDFSVDPASEELSASGADDDFLDDFFAEDPAEKKEGLGSLPETSDEDLEPLTDAEVEFESDDAAVNLGTVDITPEDESFEEDDDIEELMQSVVGIEEDEIAEDASSTPVNEFDDLDAMLASFEPEEDEPVERKPTQNELVEDELTANIAHDLEMDLDAELDSLLSSTDDEIALEEDSAEELEEEPDLLDSMNLLDGADEIETKLDLARAYIEMEDSDGAKDILKEILNEGSPDQRREAELLLETLN
ncbi:hypothetical protein GCM10011352_15580 [Marinobacterium zhoushanense]|uniref:FimV N-terminal domain-containing protein n=1 Tax=Marinobacterium zhoushanense TaxID=1679163 RepID=A0ABQ1KBH5_9GAMM|nr:FimV/HubP family polar landmark protein [Marinobacterium zhoushanense]GGB90430.1 hypothetical protein GCM10011352_15580 [Marinobacterium zhoushanense]